MENCGEIQGIHRQITSIFHKAQQLLASKAENGIFHSFNERLFHGNRKFVANFTTPMTSNLD
jgi:primosomal protein N''